MFLGEADEEGGVVAVGRGRGRPSSDTAARRTTDMRGGRMGIPRRSRTPCAASEVGLEEEEEEEEEEEGEEEEGGWV